MEHHDLVEYHELQQLDPLCLEYHALLVHLAEQGHPYLGMFAEKCLQESLMPVLLHQLQMLLHLEQRLLHHELELPHLELGYLDLAYLLEKEPSQCLCLPVRGLWVLPCVHLECLMGTSQPQIVQVP